MFAVSALSVQNLNAQNEETKSQSSTNAINKPKDKPQDPTTTKIDPKSSTNAINEPKVKPQASDESNAKEPAMRTMQNPNGEKDVTVQKVDKKQDVLDRTTGKKNIKKNRPKKVSKNEKMENNSQSGVAKPGQAQGNEGNKIQKPGKNDKMENNTQSGVTKPEQGQGNGGNKIQKPGKNDKIENNAQSGVTKPEQGQGNENDTKKNNVNPKLKKSEPKPQPNSVPRPKQQKSKEGTGTQNNEGTK